MDYARGSARRLMAAAARAARAAMRAASQAPTDGILRCNGYRSKDNGDETS